MPRERFSVYTPHREGPAKSPVPLIHRVERVSEEARHEVIDHILMGEGWDGACNNEHPIQANTAKGKMPAEGDIPKAA